MRFFLIPGETFGIEEFLEDLASFMADHTLPTLMVPDDGYWHSFRWARLEDLIDKEVVCPLGIESGYTASKPKSDSKLRHICDRGSLRCQRRNQAAIG